MLNDDLIKIADFGFCYDASIDSVCCTDYNVGTPNYICPYSLNNNKYSFQSDIWAIGVVFYELLYGTTPWKSENE